jgi:hypothetical protein
LAEELARRLGRERCIAFLLIILFPLLHENDFCKFVKKSHHSSFFLVDIDAGESNGQRKIQMNISRMQMRSDMNSHDYV